MSTRWRKPHQRTQMPSLSSARTADLASLIPRLRASLQGSVVSRCLAPLALVTVHSHALLRRSVAGRCLAPLALVTVHSHALLRRSVSGRCLALLALVTTYSRASSQRRVVARCLAALAFVTTYAGAPGAQAAVVAPDVVAFPVTVTIDANKRVGELPPIWRYFGADEPNYATAPDGAKLLMELGALRPGEVYFRAHNLLTTGDGTPDFKWGSTNLYTEKDGQPVYDFKIVDQIIDTYIARGVHPYLEIGFMPEAMTSAPPGTPYRKPWKPGVEYKGITAGWSYPPRDYAKWAELVYQWTRHCVDRYGQAEVERWYFEVWNEPNLDFYWLGTPEDFYRLHDYAIDAVRRALPTARTGGPDVAGAGGALMDGFLKHVTTGKNYATGKVGTPTDFVSFHAKGQPTVVDGHVRMGIANQLKTADEAFAKIAAVPQLANKPIVIGENDPEGCAACPGPQNAYRNGTMYSSYTAASYARLWELAQRRHVKLEGALTWAYTFVGQPWFAGYRQLATRGVDLAVLNSFRLLSHLGTEQLSATSSAQAPLDDVIAQGIRAKPDVGVLATRSETGSLRVLLWHYQDDDVPGPDADIRLTVRGIADHGTPQVRVWRVDTQHGDAFTAWQAMGSPTEPTAPQIQQLVHASQIASDPLRAVSRDKAGTVSIQLTLPLHGIALLDINR